MSESKMPGSGRRKFLASMATAAAAVASSACAAPLVAATLKGIKAQPFDDTWTRRVVAARHRAVMDSPGIDDGLALVHSTFFMQGYREQLDVGASDVVAVVVLRHAATTLALNDEIWKRYELGERSKVKDPATGKDALRNPFLHVTKDDKDPLVSPDACIEALLAAGVIILACNKATMRLAGVVAKKFERDAEEVRAEFRAGIVPGVLLQPSGIYATLRAQDVGCAFIKST